MRDFDDRHQRRKAINPIFRGLTDFGDPSDRNLSKDAFREIESAFLSDPDDRDKKVGYFEAAARRGLTFDQVVRRAVRYGSTTFGDLQIPNAILDEGEQRLAVSLLRLGRLEGRPVPLLDRFHERVIVRWGHPRDREEALEELRRVSLGVRLSREASRGFPKTTTRGLKQYKEVVGHIDTREFTDDESESWSWQIMRTSLGYQIQYVDHAWVGSRIVGINELRFWSTPGWSACVSSEWPATRRRNSDEELRELERASKLDPGAADAYALALIRAGLLESKENPFWFVRVYSPTREVIHETTILRSEQTGGDDPKDVIGNDRLKILRSMSMRMTWLAPDHLRPHIMVSRNWIVYWRSRRLPDGRHVVVPGQEHDYLVSIPLPGGNAIAWGRPGHKLLRNDQ